MTRPIWSRRHAVIALGATGAAGVMGASAAARAATLVRTPAQTEGPFYPTRFPVDSDADLVQVAGRPGRARGVVTYVTGRVLDPQGRPVAGARVEIWQCDAAGVYHHSGDSRGPADSNFQGYGRTVAAADGGYRFRTIRPVAYPGRTPHIHFKISGPGFAGLTTQMYVDGEPGNRRDFVLNAIRDPIVRRSVIVPLRPAADLEPGALHGVFTIVMGRNAG
jgi:protocatechuate 3,4-dioxygenase beta subunit